MSAKKSRGAKVLKKPQDENQKESEDSPNLSAIERASFLEGLQQNYGNPLHSTAMEEDLNVLEKGRVNKEKVGGKGNPQTEKDDDEDMMEKRSRKKTGGNVTSRSEKEVYTKGKKGVLQGKESDPSTVPQTSNQPTTAANLPKRLVGKKPAKRRSAAQTSAVRPAKNKQVNKGKKKGSESRSVESDDLQSQEESDTDAPQQRHKRLLSSDEEEELDDLSWKPSPKKAKMHSLGKSRKSLSDRSKSRKSSSGSASAEAEDDNLGKKKRKKHGLKGGTELDVVLDAFLDFCEQYRESVESKAVKQAIDCFSSNVEEQLLEKISSYKELKTLKRENTKVASLIRTKTKRLLDAKHELMRAERQLWLLQKENTELKLRLPDLRLGQVFLQDIRELNRQYLDYRQKHPREKETYGASSLPALLLETKHIKTAEHQLKRINNRLEKKLEANGN